MQRIDIDLPSRSPIEVRIHLKEGISRPAVRMVERMVRIPEVGGFVVRHIEELVYSLGGNYDHLPPEINQVRWQVFDGGFTDQEVSNEVTQTLKAASGDLEAKRRLGEHIAGLFKPESP
jgi:hypothetical protein